MSELVARTKALLRRPEVRSGRAARAATSPSTDRPRPAHRRDGLGPDSARDRHPRAPDAPGPGASCPRPYWKKSSTAWMTSWNRTPFRSMSTIYGASCWIGAPRPRSTRSAASATCWSTATHDGPPPSLASAPPGRAAGGAFHRRIGRPRWRPGLSRLRHRRHADRPRAQPARRGPRAIYVARARRHGPAGLPPSLRELMAPRRTPTFSPSAAATAASSPPCPRRSVPWSSAGPNRPTIRATSISPGLAGKTQDYYGLGISVDSAAGPLSIWVARARAPTALVHSLLEEFVLDIAWVIPLFMLLALGVAILAIRTRRADPRRCRRSPPRSGQARRRSGFRRRTCRARSCRWFRP